MAQANEPIVPLRAGLAAPGAPRAQTPLPPGPLSITPPEFAPSGGRYRVRAAERMVALLQVLADNDGRAKTLGETAHRSGMPESTALRYLATLSNTGVVEREGNGPDGRYRLGLGLFSLAARALGNSDVRAVALPYMQQLLERYQETVNLAVFRQRRLVIIEVLEGLRSIRQGARVGEQDRLRSTALGKAVLAIHTDDEALALLVGEPTDTMTLRAKRTDEGMLREVDAIRRRGYAIDDEESEVGLRCVGVALTQGPGRAVALSISGPSHLFSPDVAAEAGTVLAGVAAQLAHLMRDRGRL
jgi:IclR family acetate operon transcriptional repressor